ncbi:hypothetical protein BDQ17DRAFT_690324 [Cyathus striatus]|nr:hypothetical protein BDQ17DRAFT_690324 [Cyathus striatus]
MSKEPTPTSEKDKSLTPFVTPFGTRSASPAIQLQLPTPPATVLQRAASLPAASPLTPSLPLPQVPPAIIYEPSRDPRRKSATPPTPLGPRPHQQPQPTSVARTAEEMAARRKQAVVLAIQRAFPSTPQFKPQISVPQLPMPGPSKQPEVSSSKAAIQASKESLVQAAQTIQVALQAQNLQSKEPRPFRVPGLSLDTGKERAQSPVIHWKQPEARSPATMSPAPRDRSLENIPLTEKEREAREKEMTRQREAMRQKDELSGIQAFLESQKAQQEKEDAERMRVQHVNGVLAPPATTVPPRKVIELDLGGGEMDMDIDGGADSDVESVKAPLVPLVTKVSVPQKETVAARPPSIFKAESSVQTSIPAKPLSSEIGIQTIADKMIQTFADAETQVIDSTPAVVKSLQDKIVSLETMFSLEAQKTSSLQSQLADVSQRLLALEAHKSFISSSFAQTNTRSQNGDRDSEASTPPASSHGSLPTPELPPNITNGQLPDPDSIPGLSSTTSETSGYLNTDQATSQFDESMPFDDNFPLPIKSQRKRKYQFIAL